jgi:hypothetical protein
MNFGFNGFNHLYDPAIPPFFNFRTLQNLLLSLVELIQDDFLLLRSVVLG